MKESARGILPVAARTAIALACVITVIVARTTVSWSNLAAMLVALAVLLGLLNAYNKNYR